MAFSKYATFGMALFAMFFGSGNIMFPIMVGVTTGSKFVAAYIGLLLTAVCIPLFGLISLSLYDGNLRKFFSRLGTVPCWCLVSMIFLLAGPIGVMPRCILISYASLERVFVSLDLVWFSLLSVGVIYLFCLRMSRVLEIIGSVLTPALLIVLALMVMFGFWGERPLEPVEPGMLLTQAFSFGFVQGYNTMDLFGAFVFADIAMSGAKRFFPQVAEDQKTLVKVYLKASLIGLGLLAVVYLGVGGVGAAHSRALAELRLDQLLSLTALHTMGRYGEVVVSILVGLACLTTVISLTVSFTEFFCKEVLGDLKKYHLVLVVALITTFAACQLDFGAIQSFLSQVLELLMPALIVLTLCNFMHAIYGFKSIRLPFWLALIITLCLKI